MYCTLVSSKKKRDTEHFAAQIVEAIMSIKGIVFKNRVSSPTVSIEYIRYLDMFVEKLLKKACSVS